MFETIALGILTALERVSSTMTTGLFVVVMAALFLMALAALWRHRAAAFCQATPTLLTTLGILGTFLGIAIGLLEFDSTRIEYSIPLLLDGLKLAFTTSIVGILLSASLRLIMVLGRDGKAGCTPATEMASDARHPDDLAALLRHQAQVGDAQLAALQALTEQVARQDERLVQTLEQQHRQQLDALAAFADRLSELGSRQLITALESVIRDFNSNLGEQFGENFRRLDASVERLLQWQDQYREHMDVLAREIDRAIEGVARSEASLQGLTQQARQISTHIQDQESTLAGLRRESLELETVLEGIAELRDRAKEAFPAIDERIRLMLESIESAVLSALSAQQRLGELGMAGARLSGQYADMRASA